MKKTFDVAIIGGGIIGCSIAYYLAKEKLDVAVFESQQIGGKATSAAAGMLGAHSECDDLNLFYPFARSSQLAYLHLQEELKEISGIDIGLTHGGIYKLAFSESDKMQLLPTISLPTVDWFDADKVRKSEPCITSNVMGAAYIRDDVHVLPLSVCKSFSKSAQMLGASVFEFTNVLDMHKKDSSYVIKTTKGSFDSNLVVVANGVWSSTFFQNLGLEQKLVPVKGECISVFNDGVPLKHTLFHDHNYIMPRKNGKLVIGATMIENDWNEAPTLGGVEQLIAKAKSILPTITDLRLDSYWAGLRPQTFDQRPFIGTHPEQDGILFATGHYRNGILLAPATGQMIRDLILQKEVRKDWVEAFKINRLKPVLSRR
ncbi:glycine oxidase ThiO [Peribacillus saganii]|uniref:glycine oxidase n=1 Tax=Peribacillus saganii TaxID=2303992 RepID=A0A372LL49_9BACI|nr:glycine oxidase ThiO [Peribacillus saganii]RFU67519.1 glycine oxidase ThiO [Peribacillus saganii]